MAQINLDSGSLGIDPDVFAPESSCTNASPGVRLLGYVLPVWDSRYKISALLGLLGTHGTS
jgi:hypothetical protein